VAWGQRRAAATAERRRGTRSGIFVSLLAGEIGSTVGLTSVSAALLPFNVGFARAGVGGGGFGPAVWGACAVAFGPGRIGFTTGGEFASGCAGPYSVCCVRQARIRGARRRNGVRARRRAMVVVAVSGGISG
jgi:hypothetical protein